MTTIDDVAAVAEVSRSTVSRAFSRPEVVNLETHRRIMAAAEHLGYIPNRVARSLATRRYGSIGLFVPDIANPFFPPMIKTVQEAGRARGLALYVVDSDEHVEDEVAILRSLAQQVDGMILASPRTGDEALAGLAETSKVVTINREVPGVPAVAVDGAGMAQALEHLVALGHQRIVYLTGPGRSYTHRLRVQAVRDAAARLGIEVPELGPLEPRLEAGALAADLVLAHGATAVIAYNDLIALGLLQRLAHRGVRAGAEVSVVGVDDSWAAQLATPPLTTVRIPGVAAGRAALRMLFELIDGRAAATLPTVRLASQLVVRSTTGPPG